MEVQIKGEELIRTAKQFIKGNYPLAVKFVRFAPTEKSCVLFCFGDNIVFTIGLNDFYHKDEFLTRIDDIIKGYMSLIDYTMSNGIKVCDECSAEIAKYPLFTSSIPIICTEHCKCHCSIKNRKTASLWRIIETSLLEPRAGVIDALRILLANCMFFLTSYFYLKRLTIINKRIMGADIPVEEMIMILKQFIEDEYPTVAKFFEFMPIYDEEPRVSVRFSGVSQTSSIRCSIPGWTKEELIVETLSRIRTYIVSAVGFIEKTITNGLHICEKCEEKMAKYPRLITANTIIRDEKCINKTDLEFVLGIADGLEPSLERQENVVDTLRSLPLPISQEIMMYFVA